MSSPPRIIVSYSHRDKAFLASLLPYLETLEAERIVKVWSDRQIDAGERWREEIDAALDVASIAILLISQNFLASKVVREQELPRILQRQLERRLTVLPVFIKPSTVNSASIHLCLPNGTERRIFLNEFQGFGTPEQTLKELPSAKRERCFIALHDQIRTLAAGTVADPHHGVATDATVTIEPIVDYGASQHVIEEALCLYARRIPAEEQYDHEMMVGIVRRHLLEEYGPDWKMHFLVARQHARVVGLLIAYDDLKTNLTFVSYLANDKLTAEESSSAAARRASVLKVGRQLGETLLHRCKALRAVGTPLRLVFEIDPPTLAPRRAERRRREGRFQLFEKLLEEFEKFAPYEGLHLRALDTLYIQPPLGWHAGPHPERPLVLCYAAPALFDTLSRFEAVRLLDWVYLSLYDADVIENPVHRPLYKAHVTGLLARTTANLPESVPLLRSLRTLSRHG